MGNAQKVLEVLEVQGGGVKLSPEAQGAVDWSSESASWLLKLQDLAKSLLKAIDNIKFQNPKIFINIVECALIWHSEWLQPYLYDKIKETGELYVWLSFAWHHNSHEKLLETVEFINNSIRNLGEKERKKLYSYILDEFESGRLEMRVVDTTDQKGFASKQAGFDDWHRTVLQQENEYH